MATMTKGQRVLAAMAAAMVLAALQGPAMAAKYVSWEGTWHLDKQATHYPDGVIVTDNDLVVAKDNGQALKYSETVTSFGKTATQTYDGAYDGKPYDVGAGETMAFRHLTATSYRAVRHDKTGFVTERSTFVLSHGGKTLTCHVWARQPGGKPIRFDEIFQKGE